MFVAPNDDLGNWACSGIVMPLDELLDGKLGNVEQVAIDRMMDGQWANVRGTGVRQSGGSLL